MIGKYMTGYKVGPDDLHVPDDWDYWFAVGKSAYDSWQYDANENGVRRHYGSEADDPDNYLTDVLRTKAVEFLDSNLAADPFLLIVTPMAPHAPFNPAPRDRDKWPDELYPTDNSVPSNPSFNEDDVSDKPWYISMLPKVPQGQIENIHERYRDRLRCMESVADLVEAVIDKLHEIDPGLANTYVFFTSDHGFHMGEHRLGQDELQDEYEVPTPGGKNTMYEEDIRVPLWVRGPNIDPGTTVTKLLGNVDLAPMFCAIAGISPVGSNVDGRSFLPLLEGDSVPWRNKYLITRGQSKPYAGIRMANDTVFADLTTPAMYEIKGEYYDLEPGEDPYQLENGYLDLEEDDPAGLADLQAKVAAYQVCAGDTCRIADSS